MQKDFVEMGAVRCSFQVNSDWQQHYPIKREKAEAEAIS